MFAPLRVQCTLANQFVLGPNHIKDIRMHGELNHAYSSTLKLKNISLEQIHSQLFKYTKIEIAKKNIAQYFHLIAQEIEYDKTTQSGTLKLAGVLAILDDIYVNRVFRNSDLIDIIKTLCAPISFANINFINFNNLKNTTINERIQLHISNLQLVKYLAAEYGFYFFQNTKNATPEITFIGSNKILYSSNSTQSIKSFKIKNHANEQIPGVISYSSKINFNKPNIQTNIVDMQNPKLSTTYVKGFGKITNDYNFINTVEHEFTMQRNYLATKETKISQCYLWFYTKTLQGKIALTTNYNISHADKKYSGTSNQKGYTQNICIISTTNPICVAKVEQINTDGHLTLKESYTLPPIVDNNCIAIECLAPPIIINTKNLSQQGPLTKSEIEYLTMNGNNALLFIHGYNVEAGAAGKYIQSINQNPFRNISKSALVTQSFDINYLPFQRTTIWDQFSLTNSFGAKGRHVFQYAKDTELNGYGAHNWFKHMEYNLNQATALIHYGNYSKYARMVGIMWPGAPRYTWDYISMEPAAIQAGKKLVALISQLKNAGIQVNIIAHSLGNRVLLNLMQQLALQGKQNFIEHVIMWQPAVPDTALSNNKNLDTTILQNSYFPLAYSAANKISVLYSKHDHVLKYLFTIANTLGVPPTDVALPSYWHIKHQHRKLMQSNEASTLRKLIGNKNYECAFNSICDANQLKRWDEIKNHFTKLKLKQDKLFKTRPAMGYKGVYTEDIFIKKLIAENKLNMYDTSKWLKGHSDMKIPSQVIMQNIYKDIIFGENGIQSFGAYKN